jgi:hypothetical protein
MHRVPSRSRVFEAMPAEASTRARHMAGKLALLTCTCGGLSASAFPPGYPTAVAYIFGLYALLGVIMDGPAAAAAAAVGIRMSPHFDAPFLSSSLADLWSRRWNLVAGHSLRFLVYDIVAEGRLAAAPRGGPPARVSRARRLVAMTAAFVGSGVMHEILLLYVMVCVAVGRGREEGRASARHRPPLLPLPPQPGFCPYSGYWFVYFTSQALGLIAEGALARAWTARGLPPSPRWLAVPAVVGSGLLWAHWLFLPPVHNTTLGARVLDSLDGSARWIVGALSGGKR